MARSRLIPVFVLAAAIGLVGFVSVAASQYNDVGSLSSLAGPARVTVSGDVLDLGRESLVMVYDGRTFLVDARGPYAIAEDPETGEAYALFLLRGDNGFTVAALYPAEEFVARYGSNPVVEAVIVVDGVYNPDSRVEIGRLGPGGFEALYEAPVLEVTAILKGCHSSYQQPQANTG